MYQEEVFTSPIDFGQKLQDLILNLNWALTQEKPETESWIYGNPSSEENRKRKKEFADTIHGHMISIKSFIERGRFLIIAAEAQYMNGGRLRRSYVKQQTANFHNKYRLAQNVMNDYIELIQIYLNDPVYELKNNRIIDTCRLPDLPDGPNHHHLYFSFD